MFIHREIISASASGSTGRSAYGAASSGVGGGGAARTSSLISVSSRGKITSGEPTGNEVRVTYPRSSTPARRAGERLRDRQPARRVVTDGGHVQLTQRAPLGDQKAEVLGRPGHPLRGSLRSPRPEAAIRGTQFDPEWFTRRRQLVDHEREIAGPHPDV